MAGAAGKRSPGSRARLLINREVLPLLRAMRCKSALVRAVTLELWRARSSLPARSLPADKCLAATSVCTIARKLSPTVQSADLVWAEGSLRVEGDVKLFNGKLDLRDQNGLDSGIPLTIGRVDIAGTGSNMQVVIGKANLKQRFGDWPARQRERVRTNDGRT